MNMQEPKPRLGQTEQGVTKKLIDSVYVGSTVSYKGVAYEMKELPSEENGQEYKMLLVGTPMIQHFTKEELEKAFESGEVILTST